MIKYSTNRGTMTARNHGDAMAMTIIVLRTAKNVAIKNLKDRGIASSIVYTSYSKLRC